MTFPTDNFRHGKISKYFPQGSYGFVKDDKGNDVYFHLDEVRMLGDKKERSHIKEGLEVGFDIGLTARGKRVTQMKVY